METVVEDNVLTDSGTGMKLDGTMFNTDVLRNTISAGSEEFLVLSPNFNNGGIGLHDDQGGYLVSGMMVRNNSVTPLQTINNSNGCGRECQCHRTKRGYMVWPRPEHCWIPCAE